MEAARDARAIAARLPAGALDAGAGVLTLHALRHALLAVCAGDAAVGAEAPAAVRRAAGDAHGAVRATRTALTRDAGLARRAGAAAARIDAATALTNLPLAAADAGAGVRFAGAVDAGLPRGAAHAHAAVGRVAGEVRSEAAGAVRAPCAQGHALVVRRVAEGP